MAATELQMARARRTACSGVSSTGLTLLSNLAARFSHLDGGR